MIAAEYAGMQSGIAAATAPIEGAKRGAMLRSSRLPQRGQGSPARRKSTAISQTSHDGRRRPGIASRSGRISVETLRRSRARAPMKARIATGQEQDEGQRRARQRDGVAAAGAARELAVAAMALRGGARRKRRDELHFAAIGTGDRHAG